MIGIFCALFALVAFFSSAMMILKVLENSDKARK